jgi:type I restriction enzyme S subunit
MSEWKEVTLGDIIVLQRGYDLPDEKRVKGTIPIIGSAGITGYHNVFKVKGPCVTMGRSGNSIGKITFTKVNFWPHNACMYIKDLKGNDIYFVYYFLHTLDFKLFNSGGAQPSLNRNLIYPIKIRIPEINIQAKIGKILSAYDDLIENNLKRIKLLEELAQRTYEDWFVKFRVNGVRLEVGENGLPEGWKKIKVEDAISYKVDNRGRNPNYYCDKGIPVLDNHLITNSPYVNLQHAKRFLDDELYDNFIRKYTEPNDVLITLVGTVANIAFAPKAKCAIIQNTIGLRCNSECNQYFLFWFLRLNKQTILNLNRGSAQPSIKVGDLFAMDMLLPEKKTLNKFESYCQFIFDSLINLGRQNEFLRESRDILLPRLMSGKINVERQVLGMVAESETSYN